MHIDVKTLKTYLSTYRRDGEKALIQPGYRHYQTAEKQRAVLDVKAGKRYSCVAAELGASEYTVRRWVAAYNKLGLSALKDKRGLRRGCKTVSQQDYEMLSALKASTNNNNSALNERNVL